MNDIKQKCEKRMANNFVNSLSFPLIFSFVFPFVFAFIHSSLTLCPSSHENRKAKLYSPTEKHTIHSKSRIYNLACHTTGNIQVHF